MNDEVEVKPKKEPAEVVGEIVTQVIKGWPVYGAVLGVMFLFAKFYLADMISAQIVEETHQTATVSSLNTNVALLSDDVDDLEGAVTRLDTSIQTLNTDVKETLRIIATQAE